MQSVADSLLKLPQLFVASLFTVADGKKNKLCSMCHRLGPGAEKSWHCGPGGVSGGGFLHHLPHPGCLPDPGNTRTRTCTPAHTLEAG